MKMNCTAEDVRHDQDVFDLAEHEQEDDGRDRQRGPTRRQGDDRDDRDDRDEEASEERISLGVLPPSIGAPETDVEEDEVPKPRRRARKPRTDGDSDETSPAA